MPPRPTAAGDMLALLCRDLRQLRDQAGGPSVRALSARVGLGKSQVDAILNGRVRRLPEWTVVRAMVAAFYTHASDRGRLPYLSIRAGLDEYWRPRYAVVEHAFTQRDEVPVGVVPRQLPPVAHVVSRAGELAALDRAACACYALATVADCYRQALAILDELRHRDAEAIRARLSVAEPGG